MNRTIFLAAAIIGLLFGANYARAQTSESYASYGRQQYVTPAPVWTYPRFGYGSDGYHASTYEAGVLSGLGSLYRGAGDYNVANSIAAYNWQLARNASIYNNVLERNARAAVYASVRLGQERRHQENIKKNQAVAAFHVRENAAVLAKSQLDRQNGEVKWPSALLAADFANDRALVESSIRAMNDTRQVAMTSSTDTFSQAVQVLRAKLVERKDSLRPSDYAHAKAFLDRLANESRQNANSLAMSF
jgi:hypothetical protein